MPSPISVVIRNKNEEAHLRYVLRALRAQTVDSEIVVVDNESTDGSRDLVLEYGGRIVCLPRNNFSFGRALNVGIAAAEAEIVLNLSAHALPLGRHFLEAVLFCFGDPKVAAVRCNNIGFIDDHFDWMCGRTISGAVPWRTIWSAGIVNTCCGIRKSVWQNIAYDEIVSYAEDPLWSHAVLQAGYTIKVSDAYYWYMARLRLSDALSRLYREMKEQYRYSGTSRYQISLRDVARHCLWRIPKVTLRSLIEVSGSYIIAAAAKSAAAGANRKQNP